MGRVDGWIVTLMLILRCPYSEAHDVNPDLFIQHLFSASLLSIYYVMGIVLRTVVNKINRVSDPMEGVGLEFRL